MRRIPLRYLKENSITAMDIYNSSGKLLISKSMKIDKNMMELLHKNKIIYVYIMDESREDIIDFLNTLPTESLKTLLSSIANERFIEILKEQEKKSKSQSMKLLKQEDNKRTENVN